MVLGRVLGRGGFCVVNEVKAVKLNSSGPGDDHEKKSGEKDQGYMRGFIKARCIRDGSARYAVKQLSEESRQDKTKFLKGTIDLAIEAKFLAVLDHPHIIKMRGASSFGPFDAPGYFLVLDKLTETLEDRLRKWVKTETKTKGVLGKVTGGKKKKIKMVLEKAHVAYDLATALKFMHSNGYVIRSFSFCSAAFLINNCLVSPNLFVLGLARTHPSKYNNSIIYRDVKPDNIGFDVRGEVKVFDMGLAKELQDSERNKDGTYNLTGFTGSIRYMSPEVAKSQPYNLSADVYSYGMLLWHVFANEPPFITYSCKMHDELVVHKGYRPSVDPTWPATFGDLMKECWSNNPSKRPDFSYITEILAEETLKLNPDEECCLDLDISRRSIGN